LSSATPTSPGRFAAALSRLSASGNISFLKHAKMIRIIPV